MPECLTVLHGRHDGQILFMIYLKKPICPQKRVKKAALKITHCKHQPNTNTHIGHGDQEAHQTRSWIILYRPFGKQEKIALKWGAA